MLNNYITGKPVVGILLTNYNHMMYIEQCLECLLNQTYKNIRIFIYDDNSTDGSFEYISKLKDDRIVIYRNERNIGFIRTLNIAKSEISGCDYIYRVDSDDLYELDAVESLVDFSVKYNLDVVGSYIKTFGTDSYLYQLPTIHEDIVKALVVGSPVTHSGVLIRTSVYQRVEYNQKYIYCEDYKLWCDLVTLGAKFGNIPRPLLHYRKHVCNATLNTNTDNVLDLIYKIRTQHISHIKRKELLSYFEVIDKKHTSHDLKKFRSWLLEMENSSQDLKYFLSDFISNELKRNDRLNLEGKLSLYYMTLKFIGFNYRVFICFLFSISPFKADSLIFNLLKAIKRKFNA